MIANVLTGLVAFLHFYFMYLEAVVWAKPKGLKIFRHTKEFANSTKVIMINQGVYNGCLALGLVWSLLHDEPAAAKDLKLAFLGFIVLVGLLGGFTVSKKIYFLQAAPAIAALIAVISGI